MRWLVILLLVLSCNTLGKPEAAVFSSPELEARRDFYLKETYDIRDASGFVDGPGDALLFTCLRYWGGDRTVTPFSAITETGRPLRHPEISPQISATPFSRDMFLGLLYCFDSLATDDKELFDKLAAKVAAYGRTNDWDLCGPAIEYQISFVDRLTRCRMTPGLVSTFYELLTRNGLPCDDYCAAKREAWQVPAVAAAGFERHLEVLHVLLRAKLVGKMTAANSLILNRAANAEPNNALYRAANGQFKTAVELLLDTTKFPADRPPTSSNYCAEYLWQRDEAVTKPVSANADGCITYLSVDKSEVSECGLTPGGEYKRKQYNRDWLPCSFLTTPKSATDFLVASRLVVGRANFTGE